MFVLMAMLMVSTKMQAQEPYAVLNEKNKVLTFYYDNQKTARGGLGVGPFNQRNYPTWYNYRASVRTVVFDPSFAGCTSLTSTAYWFYGCADLTTITGIEYLNTSNVIYMNYMFSGCYNLTSLDVIHFNTSKVTNMESMFSQCSPTSLDLSSFDTSNVKNMRQMFFLCDDLTSLDLSHFDTSNVTDMGSMFYGCLNLTSLDVSGFNTSKVTIMQSMFENCRVLTTLDLSGFDTSNVTGMITVFSGCSNLTTIYASDLWSTKKVTSSNAMFRNCVNLVGGQGTVYDSNTIGATYARIDGGVEAPGYFTDKTATGVKGVTNDADRLYAPAYNLSGQRLTNPRKGINIVGGKKVVVK